MNILAVVVAGGVRSAGSPNALTLLAGVPMVVRSVRTLLASGVVDRVLLRGGECTGDLLRACAGLPVDAWQPPVRRVGAGRVGAHAGQRADTTRSDDAIAGSFVLVHDAARPLTPPALFGAVLDAVRAGHRAVVPVLPLADTVKVVDGAGLLRATPDRAGFRVVQTPQAFRAPEIHFRPLDAAAAGADTVVGDPLAFAVHTPWDLQLAELLLEEES